MGYRPSTATARGTRCSSGLRGAHARIIVFAIPSSMEERRGVAAARELAPAARIVVRTRYVRAIDELQRLGADAVVVEEFEASLELFKRALEGYEIPAGRIAHELDAVRSEHYGLLRGTAAPDLALDTLQHLGIHDALELVEVEGRFAGHRRERAYAGPPAADGRHPGGCGARRRADLPPRRRVPLRAGRYRDPRGRPGGVGHGGRSVPRRRSLKRGARRLYHVPACGTVPVAACIAPFSCRGHTV